MRSCRLLVLSLGLASPLPIGAQIFKPPVEVTRGWQFTGGISGLAAAGLGDFQKTDLGALGVEAHAGFQPSIKSPLVLKATAMAAQYGGHSDDTYEDACGWLGGDDCNNHISFYDSREHDMIVLQAGPELVATRGRLRPYLSAAMGYTVFASHSDYGQAGREISQMLNLHWNRSMTFGIGIRRVKGLWGRDSGMDIGLKYIYNPGATWTNERSITPRGDGTFAVRRYTGNANMLALTVGVWGGSLRRFVQPF